jgi:Zn finger protein HypA/HybF involved in hydrogenase expression
MYNGNDMEINKAYWSTEKDHIRLSMPINKVDKERRIVTGFATLDNLDRQGDVVPKEASVRAFENFRGNIREMHQPIAVGKVVSFKEDSYFDPESKKFYNGIVVSAYVSKGAQDTWEKVLDGTLTGFSIGGEIHDSEKVYDEDLGKSYQVIKDYSLSELSLVDNPANQFANVFSIEKGVISGYLSKTSTENVYWCRKCDIVKMSEDSSCSCPQCDKSMMNIGFVESNDTEKASVVKSLVVDIRNTEIQKGIIENTFVKFNGGYGKVIQVIVKGGARLSTEEIIHNATTSDPITILKVYSQKDGTIVPTNRRVIKNISSLEKVNAISKSEVKEVSKMDSDIVIVDEIEKGNFYDSENDTQVNPEGTSLAVNHSDATVSETVKAVEIDIEDDDDDAEDDSNTEKSMANCKECGMSCSTDSMNDSMCDKCYGMKVDKGMATDEEETPEEAASETDADEKAEAKKGVDTEIGVDDEDTPVANMPGYTEGFDNELDQTKKADEAFNMIKEINQSLTIALSNLAETVKALDAKIEGVNKSVAGISNEVNAVKDSFGKRVDAVEKDTAFRKSADLGEILQEQPVIMEKSMWGGRFLTNADL